MKMNTTTFCILAAMVLLVIALISQSSRKDAAPTNLPEPLDTKIVGVFQDKSGDWWTTLAWGDGNRATWQNRLGAEGDTVKIYPVRNGKYALQPE